MIYYSCAVLLCVYSEGQYHFKLLDAQKKRQQLVGMYEKIDSARWGGEGMREMVIVILCACIDAW